MRTFVHNGNNGAVLVLDGPSARVRLASGDDGGGAAAAAAGSLRSKARCSVGWSDRLHGAAVALAQLLQQVVRLLGAKGAGGAHVSKLQEHSHHPQE